jgi:hypothetical protein
MMAAIDFTSSNGSPDQPSSLHYLNPNGFNQYESALGCVSDILLRYSTTKRIPLWGFGAKVQGRVEHCFNLTFSASADVMGINGLMQAYRNALCHVELAGPTLFGQVVR